jgi:predicted RNase H-like HicB family nuclease
MRCSAHWPGDFWSATMKFNVTIDRDEDGVWIAECPAIPGCISQGETKDDAIRNIAQAIALCLEVRAEKGLPLTLETRQIEVAA